MPIGTINNGDSGSSARTKINAALTVVDGLGNASTKNVGTSAGDVAAGDDTRFSDARTPTDHAGSHTDGTDDIQNATASQKGLATATQITKLDGIEAGADVTDAGNVAAAGALMTADLGTGVETALGVNLGSAGSVLVTDYAADAGSTDSYVATLNPVPSALVNGAHYRFKANTANTGAATIDFNGLGAKAIVKAAGGITTALADNDIRAGQWVDVVYDGTNMQMQSTLGNAASGGVGGSTGSTDNALLRADGTGGGTLQNSGIIITDANGIEGVASIRMPSAGTISVDSFATLSFGTTGVSDWWTIGELGTLYPHDNGAGGSFPSSIGLSTKRIGSIFVDQLGIKIGDGTNGPIITASGASPNENLNLNPSPAGTGVVTVGCPFRLKGYTVGTLPTGTQGDTAFVTDALTPVSLATVASGGSAVVKVFYNGTNWIVQ